MPNSISTTSNNQTNRTPAYQVLNGSHDDGLSIIQSKQCKFKKYRAKHQPNQSLVEGAE